MSFSNFEWIAEQFEKIKELERRVAELEEIIKRLCDEKSHDGE